MNIILRLILGLSFVALMSSCGGKFESQSSTAVSTSLSSDSPPADGGQPPADDSSDVGDGTLTDDGSQDPPRDSTPPDDSTDICEGLLADECIVIRRINEIREENNVAPLARNSKCQELAEQHAEDMAANGFFSHTSPTNGSFSVRAASFGVTGTIGENIAYGQSVSTVDDSWMASTGHRANILSTTFKSTGLAIARVGTGPRYYVQCFTSQAGD